MQHDRQLTISAAGSRKSARWTAQSIWWSEFISRLHTPVRSAETLTQYLQMPKGQQDELKDVGGYVAGSLRGGLRKASHVEGRDIITLDMDNVPPGGTDEVLRRVDGLQCGYAVYSTRKHQGSAPRLRVLLPLDRTVTADEYEPIARKMAEYISLDWCDPSTFEASRLMYWPSCCCDAEYVFHYGDKRFLSAGGILALYTDWRDVTSWPQVPGAQHTYTRLAAKQGDPLEKPGVVGAFCRIYNIYSAMERYLPGIYLPCESADERYTFAGGSTTGGAVIYDDGKFLYSHHATDPCGGRLVNAFDLVRLHLFSDKDDDAKPDTPVNKLPSFMEMVQFAANDEAVRALANKEKYERIAEDFETTVETPDDLSWMDKLEVHPRTLDPEKTIDNFLLILAHDARLKEKIAFDEFTNNISVLGALPWNGAHELRDWNNADDSGLAWYIEKQHRLSHDVKLQKAVTLHAMNQKYHRVREYLSSLQWDGVARLDTLIVDYLGADDSIYTRTVTRKAFTAAVARVMRPGCKFDYMTILTGPQGTGKSTLLNKMGRGWFSDSLKSFEGKEASEILRGVWILELGELSAFTKSEEERIKQFLSQQDDVYRAAYERRTERYPRQCVFFGTSNQSEFLRDRTGGRRFWPVPVGRNPRLKCLWTQLDSEIDQLWAEAKARFEQGEPLFLSREIEDSAREIQEAHRERSAREGLITAFVERQVPPDWNKWPQIERRLFWTDNMQYDGPLVDRERICALEVWCEAIGGDYKGMKYSDASEINSVLSAMPEWERTANGARYGYYGYQKGFVRRAKK